ncbi:tripartite tricarboxylate transporter substrate binding protein [Alcaligenaceae bacterium]|nr:tripartite tricarboxylate transporter substrate binding protein [Alcaligenaceae bacterium]
MTINWIRKAGGLSLLAVALGFGTSALAADGKYPSKPVKVVVPLSAGGGADTIARLVASKLAEKTGQSFVVENKPGASGAIGTASVAQAPADGYTLLLGYTNMAQLPALKVKLSFDPAKDLTPISLVATSVNVLTASSKIAPKTVSELVAAVQKNPLDYSYGSYGQGSTGHFLGEQFQLQTGTKLVHVPYKGAAPMMSDLLAGHFSFAFPDIGSAWPHLKSDRIRVLAVGANKRLSFLPDVPTTAELGYPGFELQGWFMFFAPAGTPQAIIDSLSTNIAEILRQPEVAEKLVSLGLEAGSGTSAEAAQFMKTEMIKWADVAEKANMKIE